MFVARITTKAAHKLIRAIAFGASRRAVEFNHRSVGVSGSHDADPGYERITDVEGEGRREVDGISGMQHVPEPPERPERLWRHEIEKIMRADHEDPEYSDRPHRQIDRAASAPSTTPAPDHAPAKGMDIEAKRPCELHHPHSSNTSHRLRVMRNRARSVFVLPRVNERNAAVPARKQKTGAQK